MLVILSFNILFQIFFFFFQLEVLIDAYDFHPYSLYYAIRIPLALPHLL